MLDAQVRLAPPMSFLHRLALLMRCPGLRGCLRLGSFLALVALCFQAVLAVPAANAGERAVRSVLAGPARVGMHTLYFAFANTYGFGDQGSETNGVRNEQMTWVRVVQRGHAAYREHVLTLAGPRVRGRGFVRRHD